MAQEPFPGHGQDGEEPGGPASAPAAGSGPEAGAGDRPWPEDDWDAEASIESLIAALDAGKCEVPPDGPGQGLFVCLPAEELTLAGFAADGRADTMAPGPLLATLVHAVTGDDGKDLAGLSEDQLVGVISAVRRLESRMAWAGMAAVREFAARRPPGRDRVVYGRTQFSASAADQLAMEFSLTWQSVAGQIDYACQDNGGLTCPCNLSPQCKR